MEARRIRRAPGHDLSDLCARNSAPFEAKSDLQDIWMAEKREDAFAAFDRFLAKYDAKYSKACRCLGKDRDSLLAPCRGALPRLPRNRLICGFPGVTAAPTGSTPRSTSRLSPRSFLLYPACPPMVPTFLSDRSYSRSELRRDLLSPTKHDGVPF